MAKQVTMFSLHFGREYTPNIINKVNFLFFIQPLLQKSLSYKQDNYGIRRAIYV
jgi:hypothetical protein